MAFVRIRSIHDSLNNGEWTESESEMVINTSLIRYVVELQPKSFRRDLHYLRASQEIIVVTRMCFDDDDYIDMQGSVVEVCLLLGIDTAIIRAVR